jgi:UDP-glucose 4-epimerase
MKILVTGGAGYIGSAVVEQLVANGESVVVFDNLSQGHRAAVHPDAVFVEGDLANRAAIDAALKHHHPDAVMHFASKTLVGESMQKPLLYLGDNVTNGLNLFGSMIEHGVKRIIVSSTANLFDKPERMPIDESERIIPGSPYGESKFILERILHWLDRIHGVRFACLRYFNAAGATLSRGEDHHPELHLIPIVLQVAMGKREKALIFGADYPTRDGTCVRDYVHVVDLAQAHIRALGALDSGSRYYNLGNGEGFTVKEVIDTVSEITGKKIRTEIGPRREGDPAVLVAASGKIRQDLGWEPKFPHVRAIIESAWRWHQANPDGYPK